MSTDARHDHSATTDPDHGAEFAQATQASLNSTQPAAAPAGDNGPAGETGSGSQNGRWSVVVAALCVVATFVASWVFFSGYLALARLPGPIPPMDAIPQTPDTAHARTLMQLGGGGYLVALALGLVALVGGIRYVRRPDGFRYGVWAIALVACTPILAVMMLAGMDAS